MAQFALWQFALLSRYYPVKTLWIRRVVCIDAWVKPKLLSCLECHICIRNPTIGIGQAGCGLNAIGVSDRAVDRNTGIHSNRYPRWIDHYLRRRIGHTSVETGNHYGIKSGIGKLNRRD